MFLKWITNVFFQVIHKILESLFLAEKWMFMFREKILRSQVVLSLRIMNTNSLNSDIIQVHILNIKWFNKLIAATKSFGLKQLFDWIYKSTKFMLLLPLKSYNIRCVYKLNISSEQYPKYSILANPYYLFNHEAKIVIHWNFQAYILETFHNHMIYLWMS